CEIAETAEDLIRGIEAVGCRFNHVAIINVQRQRLDGDIFGLQEAENDAPGWTILKQGECCHYAGSTTLEHHIYPCPRWYISQSVATSLKVQSGQCEFHAPHPGHRVRTHDALQALHRSFGEQPQLIINIL